ncbi:MAG: hypothetical protein R3332_05560 [Pseudohongiellaceae bacterium]|nr:hypothetical protein [Pseudohongiellaceae bacterium]
MKLSNFMGLAATVLMVSLQANAVDETKQLDITAEVFDCLGNMTKVGDYFVTNILGELEETKAVAESEVGGIFPPGSLVSLIPDEVMVKHKEGWNPQTNDWEFFLLNIEGSDVSIADRGTDDVINKFDGNCLTCHQLARPEWDFICGTDHGCAPLPVTREQISAIQNSDSRCEMKD